MMQESDYNKLTGSAALQEPIQITAVVEPVQEASTTCTVMEPVQEDDNKLISSGACTRSRCTTNCT